MWIRTLDYYEDFHCLAGDCPHTCCTGWEIVVDPETAARYAAVPGVLGEKLHRALKRDADGDLCFAPDGGRCPFLEETGLCEIHRCLGEDWTSETCQQHPRFTEDYGPFREITLSASCPEANRLLLAGDAPLRIRERETSEAGEEGDPWLPFLLPLREGMLERLVSPHRPLQDRLREILLLARDAQDLLDFDQAEALPEYLENWSAPEEDTLPGPGLFPEAFHILAELEEMEPGWRELLHQAESGGAGSPSEGKLSRIGGYFLFRYLLKCVNDGDLLGRVQLAVFAVLTVERLAPLCGYSEALRRFSGEIEHSQENLDALQEAFRQQGPLSLERFLGTLGTFYAD